MFCDKNWEILMFCNKEREIQRWNSFSLSFCLALHFLPLHFLSISSYSLHFLFISSFSFHFRILCPFPHSLSISSFSVNFLILCPFPNSLSISSFSVHFLILCPFPYSLSISSQFPHFLSISSFSFHFLAARLQGCNNFCSPVVYECCHCHIWVSPTILLQFRQLFGCQTRNCLSKSKFWIVSSWMNEQVTSP